MVSRQETARPLLTPGEVMQLPPADEIVMVSGCHPIRAKKARYYEDAALPGAHPAAARADAAERWTARRLERSPVAAAAAGAGGARRRGG